MKQTVVLRESGIASFNSVTITFACGHRRRYSSRTPAKEKQIPKVGESAICIECRKNRSESKRASVGTKKHEFPRLSPEEREMNLIAEGL